MSDPVVITRHRLRFQVDRKTWSTALATCKLTALAPEIPRGVDLQIEVGIYDAAVFADDFSNVAQLILEIHETRSGPALIQKTLTGAELDDTLTAETWATGAADKYHALFALTGEETQFDMSGANQDEKSLWLVIHAVTNDDPAQRYTLGGGALKVIEDGAQNDLQPIGANNYSFRVLNGDVQFRFPDGKYRTFIPAIVDGQPNFGWGDPED